MKCSFCGCSFNEGQAEQACRGCPIHQNCDLVRCPRCGYEMLPEPGLILWLRVLLTKKEGAEKDPPMKGSNGMLRLTELSPGQSGCVVRLLRENGSGRHFMKLMAMGIYPGANLELLRRSPTYVFRSGYSQFAIDADLAHMVLIGIDEKGSNEH